MAALLGMVALTACSAPAAQQPATTPPAGASASRLANTPGPPSPAPSAGPSPAPSSDLAVSRVDFTCRLPVVINSNEFQFTGGFISFPAGTYQSDPDGAITGSPTNVSVTTKSPVLRGTGSPFYDLAMKRWLPVGVGQTSPDGRSYAYMVPSTNGSDTTQVHLVQVTTGSDRVITIAPPPAGVVWQVEDFDGRSVFLTRYPIGGSISMAGVWRLDVATASLRQLTQAQHVLLVQNGTAWIGLVNPDDPSPPVPGGNMEAFDTIAAVNLSTGAQTTWVYEPGRSVLVKSVDEFGRLLASISSPPDFALTSIVFYQSAGSVGDVVTAGGPTLGSVEPDRGQLWFGSARGIYFWTAATGFMKVYAIQDQPTGVGQGISPAGHCL